MTDFVFGGVYSKYPYLCELNRYIGGGVSLYDKLVALSNGIERSKVLPGDHDSVWVNTDHEKYFVVIFSAAPYIVPSKKMFDQFHYDTTVSFEHPRYYRIPKQLVIDWELVSYENRVKLGLHKSVEEKNG